jgi:dihydroxyacetone kinase
MNYLHYSNSYPVCQQRVLTVFQVTGGGSGHLPVFLGYVGKGLCTGVAISNVFSSPSPEQMLAATKAADGGAGVLYLYGNYSGDVMNFDMAAELADFEGITTATVLLADDVASAPPQQASRRRGVGGLFYTYKLAGAAPSSAADLQAITAVAEKVNANLRSMGVGLTPTILPAAGKPTFTLADDEMEIGIGIHGEPGVRRAKLESADAIASDLVGRIVADLALRANEEVSVLVNGLGATPLEKLYIVYRKVHAMLSEHEVSIYRPYIGEYATSLEMAG